MGPNIGHGVKVDQDPGTWYLGTLDLGPPRSLKVGPGTRLKFKSGTTGPPSKFKIGTPGPPTKFKSGTFIITFLHCYIYNMEIIFHE